MELLPQFLSSFFLCFVSVHIEHPYILYWHNCCLEKILFILLDRSDFHMINSLSITVHAFTRCILISLSVETAGVCELGYWFQRTTISSGDGFFSFKISSQKCYELYWKILEATPHETTVVWLLTSISKTIQVKWTRHVGHWWRSKDELISDVLLWTPIHGCASIGRPARTYLHWLCADTGCSLENLLGAMDDRDWWKERESGKSMLTVRLDNNTLPKWLNF